MTTALARTTMTGPLGRLELFATEASLVGVYFDDHRPAHARLGVAAPGHRILSQAVREFEEYFAGERDHFEVPLAPLAERPGTPFQHAVWGALATIPIGVTWSYGDLARAIGRPDAARAVGAANGRNPLSIVVPCHRVVGASGSLVGYAGGVGWKRWLLERERLDARGGATSKPEDRMRAHHPGRSSRSSGLADARRRFGERDTEVGARRTLVEA